MARLQGRVALVLGGSGGIGGAIAQGFAREGAQVAVAGRTPDKVDAAVRTLADDGVEAKGFPCDLGTAAACRDLMAAVVETFGRLDILVCSQGVLELKPAAEVTEDEYDHVLGVNLRSVFYACQAAHAHMRTEGGAIINIASMAAHRGWPSGATYAASKHGVLGITRTFASEWAADGIRVNSISPGFFLTELNRDRMKPERKQTVLARTPAGRFGELDELVGAAVFLASDEAHFVTGTDIAVDGGYLAQGI